MSNFLNRADYFPAVEDLELDAMSREIMRTIIAEQVRSTPVRPMNNLPYSVITTDGMLLQHAIFFLASDVYRQNPIVCFKGEHITDSFEFTGEQPDYEFSFSNGGRLIFPGRSDRVQNLFLR